VTTLNKKVDFGHRRKKTSSKKAYSKQLRQECTDIINVNSKQKEKKTVPTANRRTEKIMRY
jgi:hypothetical protein